MGHKDKYCTFGELAQFEEEGEDYRIVIEDRGSRVSILAPHGGDIEPKTTEVAEEIAGYGYNLYSFKGLKKHCNYDTLHISSHRFDEPKCLRIIHNSEIVVAIHGSRKNGERVFIGGRDYSLKEAISHRLRSAKYTVQMDDHPYPARNQMNICNRGATGEGVQLELTRDLREDIDIRHFANAAHGAISDQQAA